MRKTYRVFAAAMVLLVGLSTGTLAQVNTLLEGTVTDSTGAFIPNAEVTATHDKTGVATTSVTNETGHYQFTGLPPGHYTLTAQVPGFQTGTHEEVELTAGKQGLLNFTLEVSVVATTVVVGTRATLGRSPSQPCRSTSSPPKISPVREAPIW